MSQLKSTQSSHTRISFPKANLSELRTFDQNKGGSRTQSNSSNTWDHQKIGESILKSKLKEIIAKNVDYYKSKIQISQSFKPNDFSLKLHGKTPNSLYKAEYFTKDKFKQDKLESIYNKFSLPLNYQFQSQNQPKLSLKTTYQKQFIPRELQNLKKKQKRKNKQNYYRKIDDAPTFMDTHNQRQYKNWGPGSVMPSMKPENHPATTNMPFKSTTMYKNQFHQIKCSKSKIIRKQQTYPKSVDLWMSPKSNYGKQFGIKKIVNNQPGYYPQHHLYKMQGEFKNATEYSGSYVEFQTKTAGKEKTSSKRIKSVAQLQKLIMDL